MEPYIGCVTEKPDLVSDHDDNKLLRIVHGRRVTPDIGTSFCLLSHPVKDSVSAESGSRPLLHHFQTGACL